MNFSNAVNVARGAVTTGGRLAKKGWQTVAPYIAPYSAPIVMTAFGMLGGQSFGRAAVGALANWALFTMFPALTSAYYTGGTVYGLYNSAANSAYYAAQQHNAHGYINYHTRTREAISNRSMAINSLNYHYRSGHAATAGLGGEAAMFHRT